MKQMRRIMHFLTAFLSGFLMLAPSSMADEQARFLQKKELLEQELTLAGSANCYFICNLREKALELKSNATTLRTWKMSGLRVWGKPVPLKVVALGKKSALNPPQRNLIKPGEKKEETGKFELQA